jgi:glycosyltransferase involved in cell wall biosynthesis
VSPATSPGGSRRVLIAIPAYNESSNLGDVIRCLRAEQNGTDILVVDDGSADGTGSVAQRHGATVLTHLCNLGYGRAIQTALKFADRAGYDILVTYDADGQHRAEDVGSMLAAFAGAQCDVLIGSRFVPGAPGYQAPLSRRLGMVLFSHVVRMVTGIRIHDTSSGFRVIRRSVFGTLTRRMFVDFHAEAIVYLLEKGFTVKEHPITVDERRKGTSMYGVASIVKYPLKTLLLVVVGLLEARLAPGKTDDAA